jgi:hypothetical protein
VGVNVVAAYAQNLGIFFLEPAVCLPERDDLGGSTTREVQHVEGEDHVLLTPVLAQGYITLTGRGKSKFRCRVAQFSWHNSSNRLYIFGCSVLGILRLTDYTPH